MTPNLEPLKETDPRGFGGWKIKGRLGEGGYSTIFLAEKNHQLAAIKMIRSGLLSDETVFNRFAIEINNLERIEHPGIAKYLESDLSTDVPYIAVEYIDGETLEHRVKTRAPLKMEEWLDCLNKVADALDYCHKIDITHKDVSPGNIILGKDGPKLIDFGISYHAGDQRITQPDETVGTPAFMSPEHWDSEPRFEMDIFSLGSTFVFAGSGKWAFTGNSKQEIRSAIWNAGPNLEGLNSTQKSLLTPLLYKDLKDRPKLSEVVEVANQLKANPKISVFESYLKGSERKLVKQAYVNETNSKWKNRRNLISAIALTAFSAVVYLVVSDSNQSITLTKSTTVKDLNSGSEDTPLSVPTIVKGTETKVTSGLSNEAADCYKAVERKSGDVEKLCSISAAKGDIESIWYLGDELQKNNQYSQAAKWFLLGAKKGDYNSMLGLVNAYDKLGKSDERAIWLKECANGYEGINDTSPREAIGRCKTLYALELKDSGKEQQSILYLKDAVSYGQSDASVLLGMIYRQQGRNDLSIKAFQDGVSLGSKEAIKQLIAVLDEQGNESEIFRWLTKAANNGDMYAALQLTARYLLKKDYPNVKKWGGVCAKAGLGECNYFLGLVALAEKDKKAAKSLFTIASNQGIDEATLKLGSFYFIEEKNYDEAERLLLKLVKKDNFEATSYIVGVYLSRGDLQKSCLYSNLAIKIAENLMESKKWESKFDSLLATNRDTNLKLCTNANS